MYQFEEVTDDEGKAFAKKINAIYRRVSNRNMESIENLYRDIGRKLLNPDYIEDSNDQIDRNEIEFSKKLNKYINF